MTLAVGCARIEIHHGPPILFDDHFESGWTLDSGGSSSKSTDGEILTIESGDQNPATVSRNITDFSSDTYPKLAIRIKSITATKTWGIDIYYSAAWHNLCTGQTAINLVEKDLPAAQTIEQIRIRAEGTSNTLKIDYISINKSAVVIPLDPPTTQDIIGEVTITNRINKCSTAEFALNNIATTLKAAGPYNNKIGNKDIIIIWGYRSGDSMSETDKLFGGIIISTGNRGEKTSVMTIPIKCMDHGWELQKPPSLFNSYYSTATNGKTILKAAVDLCSYVSSALIDDASEITSTHAVDYSIPGNEVTPFTILEELAPKCLAGAAIGFDWRITPSGVVDLFPRGSISSSLTFDDDDLELIDHESDWWICWNDVTVYGKAGGTYPTDMNATNGTIADSTTDSSEQSTNSTTYVLVSTITIPPVPAGKYVGMVKVSLEAKTGPSVYPGYYKITQQVYEGGEGTIVEDQAITTEDWVLYENDYVYWNSAWAQTMTIRFYLKRYTSGSSYDVYGRNFKVYYDTLNAMIDTEGTNSTERVSSEVPANATGTSVQDTRVLVTEAILYWGIYTTQGNIAINTNSYSKLNFQSYVEDVSAVLDSARIELRDGSNRFARTLEPFSKASWQQHTINCGARNASEWYIEFDFDWADVRSLRIYMWATPASNWYYRIYGLHFSGKRFVGEATDTDSSNQWGVLKRPPELDDALDSDVECLAKAEGILALYKDPLVNLRNVKLQQGQKVNVGETVIITVSTPALNLTVRLMSITHVFSGTEWEATCELSNEPIEFNYLIKQQDERIKLATRGIAK